MTAALPVHTAILRTCRALTVLALAIAFTPTPGVAQTEAMAADPADVASPEALVEALYETVQRPPGENYDWDRMRPMFLPGARMIPNPEQTGGEFRVLTVEEFIEWIDSVTQIGGPDDPGFSEEQIHMHVERFGDIAHVFSTYQKHLWDSDEILGRGINSIQLIFHQDRWWITHIIWDEEVGAGPLPERYLP